MLTNIWMSSLTEEEQKALRRSLKLPIKKDLVYYVHQDCFEIKDLCVENEKGEYSIILIKVPYDPKMGNPSTYQYFDEDGTSMIVRIMCAYLIEMQQSNFLGRTTTDID